jgi:hypothetical protein
VVAGQLQRIAELGDMFLVLAQARLDRSGFALEPVAAVARKPSGGLRRGWLRRSLTPCRSSSGSHQQRPAQDCPGFFAS